MSRPDLSGSNAARQDQAPIFAALGDSTRLALIAKLCGGQVRSIAELAQDSTLSRQAITKHLRVLEAAGVVHSVRTGRESRFAFDPAPLDGLRQYLELLSEQWDQALARLQSFVER